MIFPRESGSQNGEAECMPCVKLASNTGTLKWLRQGPLSLVSCLTAALALLFGVAPSRAQKSFRGHRRRCRDAAADTAVRDLQLVQQITI
jgi:hypothetical protein